MRAIPPMTPHLMIFFLRASCSSGDVPASSLPFVTETLPPP